LLFSQILVLRKLLSSMIFATLISLLLLVSKLKLEVFLQRKSQFWTRNFGMHVLVPLFLYLQLGAM
ncbi:hypothetical protein S83_015601, partial [Arachis hypogaea]